MHFLRQIVQALSQAVKQRLRQWTQPKYHTMCSIGIVQEDQESVSRLGQRKGNEI